MKKLPFIIGGILGILNLILNYIIVYTDLLASFKESGFLVLGLVFLNNFPCLIFNIEGYLCLLISFLVWFGIGALIGWLLSKKNA